MTGLQGLRYYQMEKHRVHGPNCRNVMAFLVAESFWVRDAAKVELRDLVRCASDYRDDSFVIGAWKFVSSVGSSILA